MKRATSTAITISTSTLSLISVAFLWEHNLALSLILVILAIIMLLTKRSTKELKTFIICALSGAIAESLAVMMGAWSYTNPDIVGIPMWLPILWGIAAIFMVRLYSHIRK